MLETYEDVFQEPITLPPQRILDHSISLMPNSKPVNLRPYRFAHFQKAKVEKQVKEMLNNSLIQPSHSPFAFPVLLEK